MIKSVCLCELMQQENNNIPGAASNDIDDKSMGKRFCDWPTMAVATISSEPVPISSGPPLCLPIDTSGQYTASYPNYSSSYNGLSSYWFYQGAFNSNLKPGKLCHMIFVFKLTLPPPYGILSNIPFSNAVYH